MVLLIKARSFRKSFPAGSCLAIGNFDGVHSAHRVILEAASKEARVLGLVSAGLTFNPHPQSVLFPGKSLHFLSDPNEKAQLMDRCGMGCLIEEPFTEALLKQSAEEFFQQYVVDWLGAKSLHVGFHFRFGKNRAGTVHLLEDLCRKASLQLHVHPEKKCAGGTVSSSAIRKALTEGNLDLANEMLGRFYGVTGVLVRGHGRGKEMRVPTLNLAVRPDKALPLYGVYATKTTLMGQTYFSISNVGVRPTFSTLLCEAPPAPVVESHLFYQTEQPPVLTEPPLEGESVTVSFYTFLRPEKRFPSREALQAQIEQDKTKALQYWKCI